MTEYGEEDIAPLVEAALTEALQGFEEMRVTEGKYIMNDLLQRMAVLGEYVEQIESVKDRAVRQHELRIREKLGEILAQRGLAVDEARILQEIVLLADKTDITEEIVRFHSHMVQLVNTFKSSDVKGRKLDFVIQEMNREVNTMGSKSNDTFISECVVSLKCEIEKIREQVQNIE